MEELDFEDGFDLDLVKDLEEIEADLPDKLFGFYDEREVQEYGC